MTTPPDERPPSVASPSLGVLADTPRRIDEQARITVALIEDHHLVREGLRMVLGQQPDLDVIGEASDAAGAFRMLDTVTPDVLLLDLSLPDSDGVRLIGSLLERHPALRILVLSMHREAETVRQAFFAGASGYMVKGAHSDELVAAIRALTRGEQYVHSSVAGAIVEDSMHWLQSGGAMSAREREILRLIASGRSAVQIGEILGISPHTVRRHRANLLGKLNVRGSAGLTRYAVEHGIVRESS